MLPLIVASALKLTEQAAPFKPEYIIPQALLQALIRFNNMGIPYVSELKVDKIHGIIYLSTRVSSNLLFKDLDLMFNFVIPTLNRKHKNFCDNLSQIFVISDPVNYYELWLKYPAIFSIMEEPAFGLDSYDISVFNILDKYLKSKNIKRSKIGSEKS